MENYFGIYVIFWELESTETGAHSPQDTPGRARVCPTRPGVLCPPRQAVGALLLALER